MISAAGLQEIPDYCAGTWGPDFAAWCEEYLVHQVDEWAGQPVVLEPWQRQWAAEALAFDSSGVPCWKTAAWVLPRKSQRRGLLEGRGLPGNDRRGRAVCAGGCCRGREGQGDGARGTPSGTRDRLTVMNPQLRPVVDGLLADGARVWEAGRPLHEPEDAEPREEQQPRREPPPRPATAEEAPPEQETEPQEAAGELLSAEEEEPLLPETERKLKRMLEQLERPWLADEARRAGHSSPEFRRRHLTNLRRNVARTLKPRPILPVPAHRPARRPVAAGRRRPAGRPGVARRGGGARSRASPGSDPSDQSDSSDDCSRPEAGASAPLRCGWRLAAAGCRFACSLAAGAWLRVPLLRGRG